MIEKAGGWPARLVRVGPFAFLLRTPLAAVMRQVNHLYRDYPAEAADGIADYCVAVVPDGPLRRWIRPKLRLVCDVEVPLMQPMPGHLGVLAFEMGMNLQMAAGMFRYALLHAGAVERDGGGLILLGDSGAGKSTLSAMLGYGGWRFLGDEFALVDPASGQLLPYPRPVSLKNDAIAHGEAVAPADRFGPVQRGTIKGTIRHLLPPPAAIAAMDVPATPRLIVIPGFAPHRPPEIRRLDRSEAFVRLIRASPNYDRLREDGFETLARLADRAPAYALSYRSTEEARAFIDRLWHEDAHD